MQAVILAAGRSTRTYPLTTSRPKPLIPIWDRPLLEHQLAQLDGVVTEAILVVGYRREQIEDHFGTEHRGIRLRYVEQVSQRGTADAVLAARPYVNERVVVLNGDDFYHRDDLRGLAESGRALLVTRAPDPQNRAVVSIADDTVTDIVEKPDSPEPDAWCSVGGYSMEADDLALLDGLPVSSRGELELPDFILRLIERAGVRPYRIERFWLPLTYAWDVLTAIEFMWQDPARAQALGLVDNGAARGQGATLDGPVWIDEGVTIEDDVRLIGPATIGADCVLRTGAVVDRSALFRGAIVGRGACVESSVLGAEAHVGAGARLGRRPSAELEIDVKGKKVVPELEQFGAVLGDRHRVADGESIPAGTLIPEASVEPSSP